MIEMVAYELRKCQMGIVSNEIFCLRQTDTVLDRWWERGGDRRKRGLARAVAYIEAEF